ncbi:MAG TPA: NADP-dependent malic enzyme [Bacteroidales bacterium]|nr:NADP-dependent malic enzyme [Bacteroidales bacterium]HPS72196.1 NADP-dependent malic enzyme [Bacteroidales bacterium]
MENQKFINLDNITDLLPKDFTEEQIAKAKTLFYKEMALKMHQFYGGKMQTLPKAPIYGFNWFNVWYTPGVSSVSTTIRDDHDQSFVLSNRKNMVAVVSDSTRVLGDGDCSPSGGLGVMEGKAMLMKYLGGVDSVALCINSKDETGEPNPDKIIEFVKMVQPSFGAINLEDISQPNCFKVLDVLRKECDIPVWHDDAQGTACVTLAGVINALKLTGKKMSEIKVVLFGAGASNTSIARLMITDGVDPKKIIMFDSKSTLHKNCERYKNDPRFYVQWDLCQKTNPECITTPEEAFKDADVLVALSKPGPDTIKTEWIRLMADKAIVFVCANPVPEIYPYQAKEAGAYIVATGRGDFPNQVNNSVCFPSILKGTLLVSARKITDTMAIRAAHSIAEFAEQRGITVDNIMPNMMEWELFPKVAADVAMQAIKEGVALKNLTWDEVYQAAKKDIMDTREITQILQDKGFIDPISDEDVFDIMNHVIDSIK